MIDFTAPNAFTLGNIADGTNSNYVEQQKYSSLSDSAFYKSKIKQKPGYYTCAQGKIYINEILIDEAYDIQYSYKEMKEPLYGYNSKHYDVIVPGTVIVMGSFTINYKHDSYLTRVFQRTELKNIGSTTQESELKLLMQKKSENEEKAKQYLLQISKVKTGLDTRQARTIELKKIEKELKDFDAKTALEEKEYIETLNKYKHEKQLVASDELILKKTLIANDYESYDRLTLDQEKLDKERIKREKAKLIVDNKEDKDLATLRAELNSLKGLESTIKSENSFLKDKIKTLNIEIKKGKAAIDSLGQTIYLPVDKEVKLNLEEYKRLLVISDRQIKEHEKIVGDKEEEIERTQKAINKNIKNAQNDLEDSTDNIFDLRSSNLNLAALDNYEQGQARYSDLITNLEQGNSQRIEDNKARKLELDERKKEIEKTLEELKSELSEKISQAANMKSISKQIDEDISKSISTGVEDNFYSIQTIKPRPEDAEPFNILLEYSGVVHKIIEGCELIGHAHVIQQGGDNVKEYYQFIARLIR